MPQKSPDYPISIRQCARMIDKSPNTVALWRANKPVLFRAVMEWCSMHQDIDRAK